MSAPVSPALEQAIRIVQRLEQWPVAKLLKYKNNARIHSPKQVNLIAASIQQFGFLSPVIVDTKHDRIAAGHGRLMAAEQLKMPVVPVIPVDDLSEEQFRAYVLMDNKSAEMATWDEKLVAEEMQALAGAGFDLNFTGFAEEEWKSFFPAAGTPELAHQDEIVAPADSPVTRKGDVWSIGPHTLACGDALQSVLSFEERQREGLVSDLRVTHPAQLVIIGPPYAGQKGMPRVDDYLQWFSPLAVRANRMLADNGSYCLQLKEHYQGGQRTMYVKELVVTHVRHWGWRLVDEFMWRDTHSKGHVSWSPIFHFAKSPGMKRHTQSLIETKAVEDSAGHAQPWPVALPEFFIGAFTSPGDMVIDFCLGSGTTMVAAQKLGRSCLGMELLPGFCDAIVMRMTKLFPLLPVTLLETGEDWGHVALRRKAVV